MMTTTNISKDPIQNYLDFLNKTTLNNKALVTKERISKNLKLFGDAMNTFLTYPDILADIMTPKNSSFSLFFLQRMVLRSMSRSRQSFHTFTRGFSKSFLAFYSRYVNTMLVPRHKSFVTAGTKTQAAQIAKEKVVDDLWVRFPLLKNEMKKIRVAGQLRNAFVQGPDYAEFRFSHGGIFDVVGGTIRGFRRNSGIFEEVIQLDPIFTNEVAIPLLNKPREDIFGKVNPKEPHGNKTFITTAGYMSTYAHDKLIETLAFTAVNPDDYMVLGGSYAIPVEHGLLEEKTIRELISSPSYSQESFEREYMSIWSGAQKGSVFSAATVQSLRTIVRAHYRADEVQASVGDGSSDPFYVVSADMAKDGSASTVAEVIKVTPGDFMFRYSFVNLFRIDTTDYEKIGNILKETVLKYNARLLVYDANGIGAAIRDWLNKDTVNEKGIVLKGLGIINPPKTAEKDLIRWPRKNTIAYEIKATGALADQIHQLFFSRISNGSIRFLIPSAEALNKFSKLEGFKRASHQKRSERMRPYLFMDEMEKELRNLELVDTSDNINKTMRVRRRESSIQKDFFSAAEYAVFAVNQEFELEFYKKRRRKAFSAEDWVFYD